MLFFEGTPSWIVSRETHHFGDPLKKETPMFGRINLLVGKLALTCPCWQRPGVQVEWR